MGTPFSSVFDQFSMFVKDYNLVNLYNTSATDFEIYLSGFLIPAISDFKNCNQSLTFATQEFTEDLTSENIKILALLMKKYWLKRTINDITQMNLHVTDKDFKMYAEANNLTAKLSLYNSELEEVSQMLVGYGLDNVDWASWFTGVFYAP